MRLDSVNGPFQVPQELVLALLGESGRRLVAFVGSGLSIPVGLPSWEGLVRAVAARLLAAEAIDLAIADRRLLDAAEFLALEFAEGDVQHVVARVIKETTPTPPVSRPHSLIAQLGFHGIVTTNYDLLFTAVPEGSRWGHPLDHTTSGLLERARRPFVFHIHGSVHDPTSIVFARSAYDRFADKPGLPGGAFLVEAFREACVVFLGFGFRDENIARVLRELRRDGLQLASHAFAILPVTAGEGRDEVRARLLKAAGIVPIEVEGTPWGTALEWWLTNLLQVQQRAAKARSESITKVQWAAEILPVLNEMLSAERDQVRADLLDGIDRRDLDAIFFSGGALLDTSRFWDFVSIDEARRLLSRAVVRTGRSAYRAALTLLPSSAP